jgi:hypothetical protein
MDCNETALPPAVFVAWRQAKALKVLASKKANATLSVPSPQEWAKVRAQSLRQFEAQTAAI